jgi:hypothetical protein
MNFPPIRTSRHLRRLRAAAAVLACASLAGCFHNKHPGPYFRPDPIQIQVQSENFLDANVYIVAGGVAQRLGTVIGNSKAKFTYPWSNALSSGVVMVAQTIGGSGTGRSLDLSVNPGQVIDFRIASQLRQTYAVVHDP